MRDEGGEYRHSHSKVLADSDCLHAGHMENVWDEGRQGTHLPYISEIHGYYTENLENIQNSTTPFIQNVKLWGGTLI